MKHIKLSTALLLALSLSLNASEDFVDMGAEKYNNEPVLIFDQPSQRKGFRLGVGMGFGNNTIESIYGSSEDSSFATSFEIGYGITNQFSVNYIRNANWFSAETYVGLEETYVGGFGGISVNYYLKDEPNTPYVVAGLGVVDFTNFTQKEGDSGNGYMIGVGYALDNIEIEANYNAGTVQGVYLDYDQSSFQITVSYMFY